MPLSRVCVGHRYHAWGTGATRGIEVAAFAQIRYAPGPGTAPSRSDLVLSKRADVPKLYRGSVLRLLSDCLPVVTWCLYWPGPGVQPGSSFDLCSSDMKRFCAVSRVAAPKP